MDHALEADAVLLIRRRPSLCCGQTRELHVASFVLKPLRRRWRRMEGCQARQLVAGYNPVSPSESICSHHPRHVSALKRAVHVHQASLRMSSCPNGWQPDGSLTSNLGPVCWADTPRIRLSRRGLSTRQRSYWKIALLLSGDG